MVDRDTEFATMALQLHDEPGLNETLDRLVEYAQHATGCDDAGVLLLHGRDHIETAVTTNPRVATSDRLQTELREGPCVEAIWSSDSYLVEDTMRDDRWPNWGRRVADLGLRSVLGLRLYTRKTTLGALDLYAERPGYFDEDDLDVADIFARYASLALSSAREEEGLRQAISARHLIGQAQGMLMERYELDADRAFALLRRYSRDNNIKLRVLAQRIIEGGRLPDKR